jgi:adenosylhomocysteine nucleosidase
MGNVVRLGGKDVLFVMAAQAEYGPHLKRLFAPFMTGVGPVEAGVRLGAQLSLMKSQKALPDLVVSLGSAGSRTPGGLGQLPRHGCLTLGL